MQRLYQLLDIVCDGLEHLNITALHAGDFAGFARIKVVLAVLALKHFTGSSDFESLCDCFLSLHTNSYSARRSAVCIVNSGVLYAFATIAVNCPPCRWIGCSILRGTSA